MRGYEHANGTALDLWEEVYPDAVLVALTDTFSTKAFFQVRQSSELGSVLTRDEQDFARDTERARRWRVLRHDSGDPFTFAPQAKEVYERLGINHRERTIIYSDGLNLEKTLALKKHCEEIGFIGPSSRPPHSAICL